MYKCIVVLVTSLVICFGKPSDNISSIDLQTKYSGWQGVAVDEKNIYVSSDRNEKFELNNRISIYYLDGTLKKTIENVYSGKDNKNRFMSFGDITVIDGKLFVTSYNYNDGGGNEPISRILVFNKDNLKLEKEYDIGDGTAESVVKNGDYYWVVFHDRNEIRRFDINFKSYKPFKLGMNFEKEGGYQGVAFNGNDLYVNLHGSNNFKGEYAYGLDHYTFKNDKFEFVERIKPPTYGSGQGIEYFNGKIFWADRPSNKIIITNEFNIWD